MSLHQGSDKNWCLVCPLTYPHKTHNLAGHEPIRLVVGTAQSVHLQSFCEVWVMGENAANVKKKKNCIFLSWCMVYIKQEGNENPMQSMKFPYITFKCNGFMQNHRTHFLRWGGRGGEPSSCLIYLTIIQRINEEKMWGNSHTLCKNCKRASDSQHFKTRALPCVEKYFPKMIGLLRS